MRYIDRGGDKMDGINHVDVQAYFIIIGIFMISFSFRWFGNVVKKLIFRNEEGEKALDENTDSIIDTRREIRHMNRNTENLNRNIERLIDAINKKL
jgi:hypothetical protein